jgi:lysophospholipase L1-like esterase
MGWTVGAELGGLSYALAIVDSPSSGAFTSTWFPDNASYLIGSNYTTAPVAYDTDAATLQAAIRALGHPALATATVTGTNPNFTIKFTKPVRYATTAHTFAGPSGTPRVGLAGSWLCKPYDVYEVEIRKGDSGPIVGPTNVWDWEIAPSRVNYSGGPMLDIINFAYSGKSVQNFVVEPYLSMSTPNRSTMVVILATSHNEGQLKGAEFTEFLDRWRDLVLERLPNATIAVGTENPQVSPSSVIDHQSARSAQLATWAARNGYTVVDTFTAFLDDPRWDGTSGGNLMADDRHPRHIAHDTIIAPMMRYAIEGGC